MDNILSYYSGLTFTIIISLTSLKMAMTLTKGLFTFCTLGTRRYALHPMYVSPTYDQLEYSPYYVCNMIV